MSERFGFHFEGQYTEAEIENGEPVRFWVEDTELNWTPDLFIAVKEALRKETYAE